MSFVDDDIPPSPEDVIDLDEVINMSHVYALHTFVATLEGQVCVYKGDSLYLLDDSNSYWWLVKSVKTNELGYIPADNIETAFERLARQNRQKNTVLTLTTAADILASKDGSQVFKSVKWLETPNGRIVHEFEQEDYDEDYDSEENDDSEAYDSNSDIQRASQELHSNSDIHSNEGNGSQNLLHESTKELSDKNQAQKDSGTLSTDENVQSKVTKVTAEDSLQLHTKQLNRSNSSSELKALSRSNSSLKPPASLLRTSSMSLNDSKGPTAQAVSLESLTGKPRTMPASIERSLSIDHGTTAGAPLNSDSQISLQTAQVSSSSPSPSGSKLQLNSRVGDKLDQELYSASSLASASSSAANSPFANKKGESYLSTASPPDSATASPTTSSRALKNLTKSFKDSKGALKGMLLKVSKSRNSPVSPSSQLATLSDAESRNEFGNAHADSTRKESKRASPKIVTTNFLKKVSGGSLISSSKPSPSAEKFTRPTIQVLRVFAGNVQMQAQFVTVAVKPEMTVHDLLVSALRKHVGPNFNVSEWFLNLTHEESLGIKLQESDLVVSLLNGLGQKHLPGTAVKPVHVKGYSPTTGNVSPTKIGKIITNPISLLESDKIQFTLNKKVNLFERNYHLMRVFKYEVSNSQQIRMYKTVGVQPNLTVTQVISFLRHKFSVEQDPAIGYKLAARFGEQEFECDPAASISDIMYEQLKRQQALSEQASGVLPVKHRRSKNELEFVFAQTSDPRYIGPEFVVSADKLASLEPTSRPSSLLDAPSSPKQHGNIAEKVFSGAPSRNNSDSRAATIATEDERLQSNESGGSINTFSVGASRIKASSSSMEEQFLKANNSSGLSNNDREPSPSSASFVMQQMEDILDNLLYESNETALVEKPTNSLGIKNLNSLPRTIERNIPKRTASFAGAHVANDAAKEAPQKFESTEPVYTEALNQLELVQAEDDGLSGLQKDKPLPEPPVLQDYLPKLTGTWALQAEEIMSSCESLIFQSRLHVLENRNVYELKSGGESRLAAERAISSLKTLHDTDAVLTEMGNDLTKLLLRSMQVFCN